MHKKMPWHLPRNFILLFSQTQIAALEVENLSYRWKAGEKIIWKEEVQI